MSTGIPPVSAVQLVGPSAKSIEEHLSHDLPDLVGRGRTYRLGPLKDLHRSLRKGWRGSFAQLVTEDAAEEPDIGIAPAGDHEQSPHHRLELWIPSLRAVKCRITARIEEIEGVRDKRLEQARPANRVDRPHVVNDLPGIGARHAADILPAESVLLLDVAQHER